MKKNWQGKIKTWSKLWCWQNTKKILLRSTVKKNPGLGDNRSIFYPNVGWGERFRSSWKYSLNFFGLYNFNVLIFWFVLVVLFVWLVCWFLSGLFAVFLYLKWDFLTVTDRVDLWCVRRIAHDCTFWIWVVLTVQLVDSEDGQSNCKRRKEEFL